MSPNTIGRTDDMTLNPGEDSIMEIYHNLDDGRIVELRVGRPIDTDEAIWARNLSASEKEIYLQLKEMGSSDKDIYQYLNQQVKSGACSKI